MEETTVVIFEQNVLVHLVLVFGAVNFMLYKMVRTFELVDEILKVKATEQYFPVVVFITQCILVLSFVLIQ